MATTARKLIARALRLIQVLAAGETPNASEAADALEAANAMLASWSASNLIVPYMTIETLIVSRSPVGLTTRPIRVVGAYVNDGASDRPVACISQADYLGIANKALPGLPTSLWHDDLYPAASIYLYPVPDKAYSLTLRRWDPLSALASLDAEVALPGEYLDPLAANLAIRLAPEYGVSASSELSAMASAGLDLVRTINAQPVATLVSSIMGTTCMRSSLL